MDFKVLARLALIAITLLATAHGTKNARATEVDTLLALAADVSRSVDNHKFKLQREGYSAAITNPRVIEAIRSGRLGRIAVCFIEWSGRGNQKVVIDWTVIEDAASAQSFAIQLAETPRSSAELTSISGGLEFAMSQIEHAPISAKRRIIDISGDGDQNNSGAEVTLARDRALARGVIINALVVLTDQPISWEDGATYPPGGLERYYRENVIGGPGSFAVVAKDYAAFGQAMVHKFVAEIAGLPITQAKVSLNKTVRNQTIKPGN